VEVVSLPQNDTAIRHSVTRLSYGCIIPGNITAISYSVFLGSGIFLYTLTYGSLWSEDHLDVMLFSTVESPHWFFNLHSTFIRLRTLHLGKK
jgi:hypothetical protein